MKSKLAVISLGILVFLLGGIAGVISHCIYTEHVKAKTVPPRNIPTVEDVVEGMAKTLKLDGRQKAEVIVIIRDSRNRYRELWRQFRPQYQQIVQDSDNRIRALLRDEQKPLFEEYLKKIKAGQSPPPKPGQSK